jgi:hypothetical protein|nr:MAG: hypothetical protein [Bacteriophage sp.]DAL74416.1 MAG TPA: hypothetical protein [Caudoviricetes sp.]
MNENVKNIEQEQEVQKKIYYLYNGKKYELRAQVPYRNQYLLTLIEVE